MYCLTRPSLVFSEVDREYDFAAEYIVKKQSPHIIQLNFQAF
jgi:hypothetical protein